MGSLSKLGKRVLQGSARRVVSIANSARRELSSGLGELFDAPVDAAPKVANPDPSVKPPATVSIPELGDPEKSAQVYGRRSCPWTSRALALLEREEAGFEFVDLDAPQNGTLRTWLVAETKQNTEPYVFLRGRFIGGYNALDEIARLGQLEVEMMSAQERARQPSRIRIEVAPRDDGDRSPPGESS